MNIGQAAFTTSLNLLSKTFFSVDLGDPTSQLSCEFRKTVQGVMEEAGKPNFADYFPLLRKMDPQGIRQRMTLHFGKMLDLFNTIIEQRLQGKRPSTSEQGNDVLDALLGLNQEKTEEIDPSKIPYLLQVFGFLFSVSNSPKHFV